MRPFQAFLAKGLRSDCQTFPVLDISGSSTFIGGGSLHNPRGVFGNFAGEEGQGVGLSFTFVLQSFACQYCILGLNEGLEQSDSLVPPADEDRSGDGTNACAESFTPF